MSAIDNQDRPEPAVAVDRAEPARSWDPMDKVLVAWLLAGAGIVALFITFAVQNAASVEVDLLGWTFQIRRFLLMTLCAVAGIAMWELAGAYSRRVKKKRDQAQKKR